MTEDIRYTQTVREQLILAGIDEIKEHGIVGFSQRRVAAACHLSCAAPYKRFGSREGLVRAIRDYIDEQWELVAREILRAYAGDTRRQLCESCIGYLRFLNANPKFRHVVFYYDENTDSRSPWHIAPCIRKVIGQYTVETAQTEEQVAKRIFMAYSVLFGATLLPHENGSYEMSDEQFELVRSSIEHVLYTETI